MTETIQTDPYRVHESTVRTEVANLIATATDFDLVQQGDFHEGGGSYYAYASVQCALRRPSSDAPFPDRPYLLTEVVLRIEPDGTRWLHLQRSTYDLTEREAVELL